VQARTCLLDSIAVVEVVHYMRVVELSCHVENHAVFTFIPFPELLSSLCYLFLGYVLAGALNGLSDHHWITLL